MTHRIHGLLLPLLLMASLPYVLAWPTALVQAARSSKSVATQTASVSLVPLPKSCGGGLPAGANVPVCCMFGYVFIGGQAIAGARVTITSAHGTTVVWTQIGADSTQPYYRISLSDPPLSAQANETITIAATFGTHTQTSTHVVVGGGQQVDAVLPRGQANDYVFDGQIWHAGPDGAFNYPSGVAVDGTGTIYVADTANARVQVFSTSGQFLRQWGTRGSQPGQFVDPTELAVDQHGNVYVSDTGNRRIQKFSITGTWITMWGNEGGGNGQFLSQGGVAVDNAGNVYVADRGNNRIQKFTSDGAWLMSWGSFGIGKKQFDEPVDITLDTSGNIYVVEFANHRVQKFTSDGGWLATWGGFGIGNGQFNNPHSIGIDAGGNVYVIEFGNHRIQKFTSGGTWLTSWGSKGYNDRQFYYPHGLTVSANGTVYVADTNNHRVQKFTDAGVWLASWGSFGNANGQFLGPSGVNVDTSGNVYVADTGNHRVQKFANDGTWMASWGGNGNGNGQFISPSGVGVDVNGNIYIADTGNNRIQKLSSSGQWLASWGSFGNGNRQFASPSGVGVDVNGNIYIADTGNNRIQKLSSSGQWLASWGSFGNGDRQFNQPQGVAIDHNGIIYVTDTGNNRIQKLSSSGQWLANLGGSGQGDGQFASPVGVAVDAGGNVYVADTYNHRIQKFDSNGTWLFSWSGSGISTETIAYPKGVAVDESGRVYVSDSNNDRVPILRLLNYTRPIATIVAASPRSVVQGQSVELIGIGADSDETPGLAAYEWTIDSNLTPFAIAAAPALSTTNLSLGQHSISFRVRDTEGQYSDPQSISIEVVSSSTTPNDSWTFMLYLDGDNGLAPYLNSDTQLGAIYRLEHSIPNPNVTIAALYDGDRTNGGDTFRYLMRPDGTITTVARGEENMGDTSTLIAFVGWAKQQAPAAHYYLAIADHANALDGIAWDLTSASTERLTNLELHQALVTITENGSNPLDVLHFDGCLMGLLESAYQVRNMARYLVSSENEGWSAFAYESYRDVIGPHTDARTFASAIVDRYAARVGEFSAPFTIAALDLGQLNTVTNNTDRLAGELVRYALANATNRTTLTNLRAQAQKFDSSGNYAVTNEDEYLDLADWAALVHNGVSDSNVQSAAIALQSALPSFVVHEQHTSGSIYGVPVNLNHAHGVAIYYPPQASATTYQTYRRELTFASDTQWDEYLAAGLAGLPFNPTLPAPNPVAPLPLGFGYRNYLPLIHR